MTERKTTTTADERAAKVAAIKESAEQKLAAMIESGDFREYVRVAAKFHRYSVANQCLILSQMPHAEQVASFKTWLDLGRPVKKGEHGIRIWAPSIPRKTDKTDDDETEEQPKNNQKRRQHARAFHLVPVFDVSQTEGDPLPEHPCKPLDDDPANAADIIRRTNQLAAAIVAKGVRIIDDEDGAAIGRGGYWSHDARVIAIAPTDNNAARFPVLLHEAAHMLADHSPNHEATRRDRETVAELAAHIAAGALGYDTSTASVGYVATWAGGDLARIKANMNEAMRVVRELLAMMPDDGASKPKPSQAPALKIERPTSAAAVIAGEPLTFNFCQECGQPLTDKTQPLCPECQTPEPTPPAAGAPIVIAQTRHVDISGQAIEGSAKTIAAVDPEPLTPREFERHAEAIARYGLRPVTKQGQAAIGRTYNAAIAAGEARGYGDYFIARVIHARAAQIIGRELNDEERGFLATHAAKEAERTPEQPARKRSTRKPKEEPKSTPRTDELERKAKSGQPISLTDLADAIKADKAEAKAIRTAATEAPMSLVRQWRQIKAKYLDAIVLFKIGDFYETFEQDAEIVATTLDVVLTGRDTGEGERAPMAGFPVNGAEAHIAKLQAAGHKVALCDQVKNVAPEVFAAKSEPAAEQSAAAPAVPTSAPRAAVLTKALKAALSAVKPAIPGKTALPILKCVRIDARDGAVTISATNLEIGITRTIPASVDAPFTVCFDYKQLAAAVPAGDDVIHITPTSAGAVKGIETHPVDDFPVMPEPSGTAAEVDAGELAAAVNAVTHAAAKDESRPILAAVNIRVQDGRAELAAADGFRLAVSQSFPLPLPNNFRILPPARALAAWAGLKMTGKVRLGVTERQAQFFIQDDHTTFLARTIDGTFPDYRQIIPRESAGMVRLDPRQLADACKLIAPIVKDNNDVCRLTITNHAEHGEDRLTASGKSKDGAEIALSVPLLAVPRPSYTGHDAEGRQTYQIAFNVKYLSDVCKHAAGPLTFGFNTPSHAAKISDDVTTFVLMPMVIGAD